jgi:hypothetical protein
METVRVFAEGYDLSEITTALEPELSANDINIRVQESSVKFDGLSLEPASIIVSGASVLSALVTALLAYLANRRSGTIVITGASGRKIEVPKDTPNEAVEKYIELAKQIDADTIRLVSLD